ncbi:MAG: hypothetical protein IT460_06175 [Planctomycetes bacterium]|nr:hypothetical protein [Planctomycetota bacterium]
MGQLRRFVPLVLAAAAASLAGGRPASAEDAGCQQWNLEVRCTAPARVTVGKEFTASVVAKNIGDATMENVTVRLRGDQGAPCVSGPGGGVSVLVPRLAPGESKELSARFASETIGLARILGSAKDSLGWASGSCACTVEVVGLPAIQSEMSDRAADGSDRGIFKVGEEFFYTLIVQNDVGAGSTPAIKAVLSLPKELEFVSGRGDGTITVTGAGNTAETSVFVLAPPAQKATLEFRVRVVAVPASHLVKAQASITTPDGVQLSVDVESTTLR